MKRNLIYAFLVLPMLFLFAGCPDYSHLRPVPDYENMTDSAGETEEQSTKKN